MRPHLFLLVQAKLWGDYGDVLISGYASRDKESGIIGLHRAGPFSPPIFFPYGALSGASLIVTQAFRVKLECSEIPRLEFRPVIKKRIVEFHWESWDRNAEDPGEYPETGEPEDYIWEGQHSVSAAANMPEMWEVLPPVIPCEIESEDSDRLAVPPKYWFTPQAGPYRGLFRSQERFPRFIVDANTRQWFEEHAPEWVRFEPLSLK